MRARLRACEKGLSMRATRLIGCAVLCGLLASAAPGQNLFDPAPAATAPAAPASGPVPMGPDDSSTPAGPVPAGAGPTQSAATPANLAAKALEGLSLFAVTPPPPRRYAKHDLVEVIVNESSVQRFAQTYDSKKDFNLSAQLSKFPSLKSLFEDATLEEGIGNVKPGIGVTSGNKHKGEGKFNRNDQVTARISATVVDVKPNGTLVLEAKESIQSGREVTTMVLSGTVRQEDITRNNTVQSGQLAGLNIKIEHSGDVKDTAEKGIIPRVLETIFNF